MIARSLRSLNPPVPSTIMGNVNSLPNKINELAALTKNKTFRESHFSVKHNKLQTACIPDVKVELPRTSAQSELTETQEPVVNVKEEDLRCM